MSSQKTRRQTIGIVSALALGAAALVPATIAGADDSDDYIGQILPDRSHAAINSTSGVRLHLGLGGPDFGSLYWLDYSQMTDAAWKAANTPEGTDIVFDMPSGGQLSMHLSIENGVAVDTVINGEQTTLPFEPRDSKKWGAFGAPASNDEGVESTNPYGFNYRLPEGVKPALGYPEHNQDSGLTKPYDVTVRFSNISFTTPGGTAGDYRAVFSDMEATDEVDYESYTVSVDNFGADPNPGVTLTRFGELYSKYANRSQQENHWSQYSATKKPCPSFADDAAAATVKCEAVTNADGIGPGGQMFSALNTDKIAFNFKGRKPNGYGVGFLLPYQAGTVTVKHGNLPESEQSNFDLTLKTNNDDEGGTVETTAGNSPATVTRNMLIVPGQPVTYTSFAKQANNENYSPKWACQRGSLAPGGEQSGTLESLKLEDLNVEEINEDGKVGSRVSIDATNAQAYVYCSVVWTAEARTSDTVVPPSDTATTSPESPSDTTTTSPESPSNTTTPESSTPESSTPESSTPETTSESSTPQTTTPNSTPSTSTESSTPSSSSETTTSTPITVTSTPAGSSQGGNGSSGDMLIPAIIGVGLVGTVLALMGPAGSAAVAPPAPAVVPDNVVKQPARPEKPTMLAVTGADSAVVAGLALMLVVAGAGALLVSRRRA